MTTRFDFPYGVECQIFVTDADGLKRLGKALQRFEVRHELLERGGKPTFKPSRAMEEEIATRHDRVGQVTARLCRFDRRIEEASLDLGAGHVQTFLRVSIANLKAAILGSALLVFTLSFDEVAITFLLTATEHTLPMQIWAMLRRGEASLQFGKVVRNREKRA